MEIPVMTSASSHSLRSAVGACAKPTGSILASASGYSGGCLKKIIDTVNKTSAEGGSFLNKLNFTKKRKSAGDCGIRCKKNKNLNGGKPSCGQSFAAKNKNGKIRNVHIGCFREEIPKKYANVILNGFPKRLNCSGEFLAKIKSNEFFEKKAGSGIGQETDLLNANSGRTVRKVKNGGDDDENSNGCGVTLRATTSAVGSNHRDANKSNNDGSGGTDNSGTAGAAKSPQTKKNRPSNLGDASSVHCISISDVTCKSDGCGRRDAAEGGGEGERRDGDGVPTWQPKHLGTRRTALISREVLRAWRARFGSSSNVNARQVEQLLKDLQLCSTKSQVHKTLEGAGENISFEELCCLLAGSGDSRLKCFSHGLSRSNLSTRPFGKNGSHQQQIRRNQKLPKTETETDMCKYEVFLGGSCNPTTWRTDIAIPHLTRMGISFYNPQVSQWRPDLLEAEYDAKENADLMFFVMDNQTRGISTLIEVAHIAGRKRRLILVIQSYTQEKQMICGETISRREYEELRNGQEVLRHLVESNGIPVYDDIRLALQRTARLLRKGPDADEAAGEELPTVAGDPKKPRPGLTELRQAFEAVAPCGSGSLSLEEASLALHLATGRKVSPLRLRLAARASGSEEELRLEFEQFCAAAEVLTSSGSSGNDGCCGSCPGADGDEAQSPMPVRDVFLGGSREDTSWKEKIAIPAFRANGVTFFNPRISEWSERLLPVEAAAMGCSSVLLFVISNAARSVAEMAVAGHYIGLGARVVLCVPPLPEDAVFGREKLTETAAKDYARGRMYLMDVAKRSGAKAFSSVAEAVQCVVEECQKQRQQQLR